MEAKTNICEVTRLFRLPRPRSHTCRSAERIPFRSVHGGGGVSHLHRGGGLADSFAWIGGSTKLDPGP